jgi:hypothetical protein
MPLLLKPFFYSIKLLMDGYVMASTFRGGRNWLTSCSSLDHTHAPSCLVTFLYDKTLILNMLHLNIGWQMRLLIKNTCLSYFFCLLMSQLLEESNIRFIISLHYYLYALLIIHQMCLDHDI